MIDEHFVLRDRLPADMKIMIGGGGLSPSARSLLFWCQYFETLTQMNAYVQKNREAEKESEVGSDREL